MSSSEDHLLRENTVLKCVTCQTESGSDVVGFIPSNSFTESL